MRLNMWAICVTLATVGCSSSSLVTPTGRDGDLSYDQLNEELKAVVVTVSFEDGTSATTTEFRLENDSALWRDAVSDSVVRTPCVLLHTLATPHSRFEGAVHGMGKGLLIGGAAGAVIGGARKSSSHDSGFMIVEGALAGGAAGALVGLVVGAILPESHEYELAKPRRGLR